MVKRLKWVAIMIATLFILTTVWLYFFPPAILRVGSNYAAKKVCSNVFIAKREAAVVLSEDVKPAIGDSLGKLIHIDIDKSHGLVYADFLGLFGRGLAVYRPGTGCATVPDGDVGFAAKWRFDLPPLPKPAADMLWPEGTGAQINPAVQSVIANDELVGAGMRAIVIIHNGKLAAERYAAGFDNSTPQLGWSMTKSVNAALVGMVVADGKLSLEQDGFWPAVKPSDGREKIKLSDLLAMSSGLRFNEDYGGVSDVTRMLLLEPDTAAYAYSQPLVHPPGTVWSYSSGTSALLSHFWQKAAGVDSLTFPRRRLFSELGMSSAIIEADARGTFVGSSYMYATPQDWARFGQFLLQDGVWKGKQLLPEGYVAMMRSVAPASKGEYCKGQLWCRGPNGEKADAPFGLPSDTFWMLGFEGQSVAIVPSLNLVVVRMGISPESYQPQALLAEILKVNQ